jgi:hypothetical protein
MVVELVLETAKVKQKNMKFQEITYFFASLWLSLKQVQPPSVL